MSHNKVAYKNRLDAFSWVKEEFEQQDGMIIRAIYMGIDNAHDIFIYYNRGCDLQHQKIPITSVRRSLSNLENDGVIQAIPKEVKSKEIIFNGKPYRSTCYKILPKNKQTTLFS